MPLWLMDTVFCPRKIAALFRIEVALGVSLTVGKRGEVCDIESFSF